MGALIKIVSEFFGLHWLRIAGSCVGVGLVVASCVARDNRLRAEGATVERKATVEASQTHGKEAYAKSKAAVAASRKPGALDRLRADPKTCTDCR